MDEEVLVPLDPAGGPGQPAEVRLPVRATAHRLTIGGTDVVMLSGEILDAFPDTLYPPAAAANADLTHLKPLVFQIAAARYLAKQPVTDTVVHLHEPLFHYLLPAVLGAHGYRVVSTVQTNLPVNTSVYGPAVRALLSRLGADPTVADGLVDPPLDGPLHRAMRAFLPQTLLYRDNPGASYVSVLALVARSADAVDFLSAGQREHALTQAGTPFAQLRSWLPPCGRPTRTAGRAATRHRIRNTRARHPGLAVLSREVGRGCVTTRSRS